jgi:hypothetical protein
MLRTQQAQRNRFDRPDVHRDIFTDRPVAACGGRHQHAVFVGQRNRGTVDLEFDGVATAPRMITHDPFDRLFKGSQFVVIERIIQ